MASQRQVIRINSINGGISSYEFVANEDQFYDSVGIDPDQNRSSNTGRGTGFTTLVPVQPNTVISTALTGVPLWMKGEPKTGTQFVYDARGSVYTNNGTTITGLGDLNDGGSSQGNGMEYMDNYMYFSRATTIARYGPLNGSPSFTDDYWIGVLGKAALEQQAFPSRNTGFTNVDYPNHVQHRHTDGAIYFADTLSGQGVIHKIKTTKTSVEGDTDNGSIYNALDLPFGYFITDIESLGDDLVISTFEGKSILNSTTYSGSFEGRATLFFWDTVSDTYYKKVQYEFPDQFISAMENANGILYLWSMNPDTEPTGVRVARYLGGNSFEQVAFLSDADTPLAGGTVARMNQLLFGSNNQMDLPKASVWAIGLQNQPLSNALFNIVGARSSTGSIHALSQDDGGAPWATDFFYAYANSDSAATIEEFGGNSANWDTDIMSPTQGNAYWKSQWFTLGSKYKILKIKIFLPVAIASSTDIRVYLNRDRVSSETQIGNNINNTNYPSKRGAIILKPDAYQGEHSFQLVIRWFGTAGRDIALPIEIEYETFNDD